MIGGLGVFLSALSCRKLLGRTIFLALLAALPFAAGCSDEETGPQVDAVPPSAVADLHAAALDADHVVLTWTAPGDDAGEGRASRYDVRHSPSPLTTQEWSSAPAVATPPVPRAPGEAESLNVSAAGARDWYFTLRTADETFNWSLISNVANARLDDHAPPAVVVDLEVIATTLQSVTLAWTASGDDGRTGTAAEYDLRVAETPITSQSWAEAERLIAPAPSPAGARDSVMVGGLATARSYYFALIVGDEFSRWSPLSNVVSGVPGLRRLTHSTALSVFGARHACWSPDGQRLAFAADWESAENLDVYLVQSSGGAAQRVTTNPEEDDHPAWAPDGQSIAFTSRRQGKAEIWSLDPVTGEQRGVLAAHEQDTFQPAWSADGVWLAYVVRTSFSTSAIYADTATGGLPRLVFNGPYGNTEPAWFRNDSGADTIRIAFTSDRLGRPGLWYVLNVGGPAARLSFEEASEGGPDWTMSGGHLAFHSDRSGNLDVWALGQTGFRQITFDLSADTDPAWSPDSTRIAFTSRRSGKPEIWVQQIE